MKFLKKWFTPKFTIKFKSFIGNFSVATPVTMASKIKPDWVRRQLPENSVNKCPGMFDYLRAGYIITAHTDIHIKANKVGVVVTLLPMPGATQGLQPAIFDFKMVDGIIDSGDVKKYAGKIPLPWSVGTAPGYSALVLPALMHSDFLDKLFVYPGIVDYDKFNTINFVFSPIKECEFTIYAGTPLLHVFPYKRENFTAECDKATEKEIDNHIHNFPSRMKHYYRKFFHQKKSYTMTCPYEHRKSKND